MKLIHFADLHLDTQFAWADPRVAAKRRQALREALLSIVRLAGDQHVDALLCAGDLYEQDRFSPDTAAFLCATFEQVHPLPVYVSPGNHDWLGPTSLYSIVKWSPNVRIFDADHLTPVTLADGLTLWGAANQTPTTTKDFLEGFRVDRGGINIALFHGSERSSLVLQGQGKSAYAPFAAAEVPASGLTHAFVGHYHAPQDADAFTYPGNPEPLTFGETGNRGPVLVTINDDGSISRERHVIAKTQVRDVTVDLTGCGSSQEVRDRTASALAGLVGTVRVTLSGEVLPDVDTRLEGLTGLGPQLDGLVFKVGDLRVGYDLEKLRSEQTVRGEFVQQVGDGNLPDALKRRVLVTGLRALDGRQDLEVG